MPDSFDEAFPGGFEECVTRLGQEPDIDDPERLCGWLSENGFEAMTQTQRTPEDVLLDLSVEYVSVVDEPAQDSEWLLAKSADADPSSWSPTADPLRSSDVLLKADPLVEEREEDEADDEDEDEDDSPERKVWAAVLEPETVDKQGDLVPRPEIEKAAHNYLKHYRKVDEDHNLLAGSGVPIESYIIRDGPETFETPDGMEKTYPAGTWIMGVELEPDAWERVKEGELTGFSIYGDGDAVAPESLLSETQSRAVVQSTGLNLSKAVEPEDLLFQSEESALLVARAFGLSGIHEHEESDGYMPGESMEAIESLLEQVEAELPDGDDEDTQNMNPNEVDETEEQNEDEEEDEDDSVDMAWKQEDNPCWDGYVMVGTKIDDSGNEVPRCVPEEDVDEPVEQSKNEHTENANMANENGNTDRIDTLLSKVDGMTDTVDEVQKSVSSLSERVETLEEWRKSVSGEGEGETEDTEADDLTPSEVEEIAEEAATEGAEEAVKSLLDLDELPEDDEDRAEAVRKGVRNVGEFEANTDGGISVETSGIMEDL